MVFREERLRKSSKYSSDSQAEGDGVFDFLFSTKVILTHSASLCSKKDDGSKITGSFVVLSVPTFPLYHGQRQGRSSQARFGFIV